METIGSAERAVDPQIMRESFLTISGGEYANLLYSNFTEKRVNDEMDKYLSFNFIERSGGGIGLTRLMRAMKLKNLI